MGTRSSRRREGKAMGTSSSSSRDARCISSNRDGRGTSSNRFGRLVPLPFHMHTPVVLRWNHPTTRKRCDRHGGAVSTVSPCILLGDRPTGWRAPIAWTTIMNTDASNQSAPRSGTHHADSAINKIPGRAISKCGVRRVSRWQTGISSSEPIAQME